MQQQRLVIIHGGISRRRGSGRLHRSRRMKDRRHRGAQPESLGQVGEPARRNRQPQPLPLHHRPRAGWRSATGSGGHRSNDEQTRLGRTMRDAVTWIRSEHQVDCSPRHHAQTGTVAEFRRHGLQGVREDSICDRFDRPMAAGVLRQSHQSLVRRHGASSALLRHQFAQQQPATRHPLVTDIASEPLI